MVDIASLPLIEKGVCKCVPGYCAWDKRIEMLVYRSDPEQPMIFRVTHRERPVCRLEFAAEDIS